MITEKDIRARFNKNHLRKLAREVLAETTHYLHGRTTDTPHPRYTLRPGVTMDTIVNSVRFGGIYSKPGSPFAAALSQVCRPQRCWENDAKLNLRIREDGAGYDIIRFGGSKTLTDTKKVDMWIERLMTRDCFVDDATAIDIFI